MKYTALLKSLARHLGYDVVWTSPEVVSGSINPPPSLRYPGITCYLVQVSVGPWKYTGFGRTPSAARSLAESKAYLDLYFRFCDKTARNTCTSTSSSAVKSPPVTHDNSLREIKSDCEAVGNTTDAELSLMKFSRDCCSYYESVKKQSGREVAAQIDDSVVPKSQASLVQNIDVNPPTVEQANDSCVPISQVDVVQNIDVNPPTIDESAPITNASSSVQNSDVDTLNVELSGNVIGQLQELLIEGGHSHPVYQYTQNDHRGVKIFDCIVSAKGFTGKGSGYKKIVAKKTATANILKEMKGAGVNISPMSKTSKKAMRKQQQVIAHVDSIDCDIHSNMDSTDYPNDRISPTFDEVDPSNQMRSPISTDDLSTSGTISLCSLNLHQKNTSRKKWTPDLISKSPHISPSLQQPPPPPLPSLPAPPLPSLPPHPLLQMMQQSILSAHYTSYNHQPPSNRSISITTHSTADKHHEVKDKDIAEEQYLCWGISNCSMNVSKKTVRQNTTEEADLTLLSKTSKTSKIENQPTSSTPLSCVGTLEDEWSEMWEDKVALSEEEEDDCEISTRDTSFEMVALPNQGPFLNPTLD